MNILTNKFGVNCIDIKEKYKKKDKEQTQNEMNDELEHLEKYTKDDDWRKKTRGLREVDEEFVEKAKKLL